MTENSRQEGGGGGDIGIIKTEKLISKTVTPSTSSRQWTAFRNPRIVRVSRSLGGKDRHSKVCTIRGLRDRRIRLSVPTAIQLYDLQDRLGLNQPSKVVDWLIEATKSDIDKLPPLRIPHSFSHQFHHPHQQQTLLQFPPPPPQYESHPEQLPPGTSFSLGGSFYDHAPNHQNLIDSLSSSSRLKGKEAEGTTFKTNEQHNNKLFQFETNNAIMGYNSSYNNSDPNSSLSLSQFGSHGLYPNSSSAMQFSSPPNNLSVPAQLLFCPSSSSATPSSLFTSTPHAPFMANSSVESDNHHPRQSNINHIQFLSSLSNNSQLVMPHALRRHHLTPFSSKLLDSDHDDNNHSQPADMGSNDRS